MRAEPAETEEAERVVEGNTVIDIPRNMPFPDELNARTPDLSNLICHVDLTTPEMTKRMHNSDCDHLTEEEQHCKELGELLSKIKNSYIPREIKRYTADLHVCPRKHSKPRPGKRNPSKKQLGRL